MTTEQTKQSAIGNWTSLAVEVRPSAGKNADSSLKPFYLRRQFSLAEDDAFELILTNYASPYGEVPLAKMQIKGHIVWEGPHPVAGGAQKVHFIADTAYEVTPLLEQFATLLNQSTIGFHTWNVNEAQDIFKKPFPLFGLAAGQVFEEYDLIFVRGNMMFWGARHVDGRGFDTAANRPTNLQIPMIRV